MCLLAGESNPEGQLRLVFNEPRAQCGTFSRAYLHQQTVMLLAGRAGELLVYGVEQLSTMNEDALEVARAVAVKMVLASGFTDDDFLRTRAMAVPQVHSLSLSLSLSLLDTFAHRCVAHKPDASMCRTQA